MNPPVSVTEPPELVNTTLTAPELKTAGVVTVTDVAVTVPKVPATPPKVTEVVPVKLVPVIVTVVPPAVGPDDGEISAIVGEEVYVKPFVFFTEPPELVSTTSLSPSVPAGVTTVTDVALTLVIEVPATPPKVTADVPVKLVPVIVTVVPPEAGPDDGVIAVIFGLAT